MPATVIAVGDQFEIPYTPAGPDDKPEILALEDGTFIVTWGSLGSVSILHLDADGTPIGEPIEFGADSPALVSIAESGESGFTVAWNNFGSIEYLSFDSIADFHDGTPSGGASLPGPGFAPSVLETSDGTLVVSFMTPATPSAVYFSIDGVVHEVSDRPFAPSRVQWLTETEDGFLVSWLEGGLPGMLRARAFAHDGTPMGPSYPLASVPVLFPVLDTLQDGTIVATWYEPFDGGVQATIFAPDGAVIVPEFEVAGGGTQPNITVLADGSFVIVWNGGSDELQGQRFNADGTLDGERFSINTNTNGDQLHPFVEALPGGGFVISWMSERFGGVFEIHARTFDVAIEGDEGNDTLQGDDNDNIFYDGNIGTNHIYAEGGDDQVYLSGNNVTNHVYGGDGNDLIDAAYGEDFIYAGAGDDLVIARAGDDEIYGEDGNDDLRGGGGEDLIYGGVGNDRILGQGGNDRIYGDEGDDFIQGHSGDDVIDGGLGQDRIYGGDGDDTIYAGSTGPSAPFENDRVYGGAGNDTISAGNGDDYVNGNAGNDSLHGFEGSDILHGQDGVDRLYGGDGNDRLYGGSDNDWIMGGDGDDRLHGGGGADTFLFHEGAGVDRIFDFEDDTDSILLRDIEEITTEMTVQDVLDTWGRIENGNAYLDFGDGQVIRIDNVDDLQILVDDIVLDPLVI